MSHAPVRVRFAPSPTGTLHVGGARTALFNWLFARGSGGRFVLRLEDTDAARSSDEAAAAILRGLDWLGLDWDEGPRVGGPHAPYRQSERRPLYAEQLARLRAADHVYPCYCNPEELAARRAAALAAGREPGYDGRCSDLDAAGRARLEAQGRRPSWRLRVPAAGETAWDDLVLGPRAFANARLADRVLVRADGLPTYNLTVVVDDHLMGITHVLRGEDHVSNTPLQLLLYDACGWPRPRCGHLPLIVGSDRRRLAKRHGATGVEEFAAAGVLPDAMVNHLALLGWSPGPGVGEVLTREQLVRRFSLARVGSAPATFDHGKLAFLNGEHVKRLSPPARVALVRPAVAARGWRVDPAWRTPAGADAERYLDLILRALGNRFSDPARAVEQVAFFFTEEYPVDEAAVAADLAESGARARLGELAAALAAADAGEGVLPAASYEEVARATAARLGVPAGALLHPCRVAVTGQGASGRLFPVLELIGAPRVIARLRRAAG